MEPLIIIPRHRLNEVLRDLEELIPQVHPMEARCRLQSCLERLQTISREPDGGWIFTEPPRPPVNNHQTNCFPKPRSPNHVQEN